MRTTVYMVRHAESLYSPGNDRTRGLSEKGRRDAHAVTELLKAERIEAVVSSPYARAVETVKGVAAFFGLDVETDEQLRERTLADDRLTLTNEQFRSAIERVYADPDIALPGGESNRDAQRRGVEALRRVMANHAGKRIAIGTHGNIMTLILNHYDPKYDLAFWKRLTMPDIYKVVFEDDVLVEAERLWEREPPMIGERGA